MKTRTYIAALLAVLFVAASCLYLYVYKPRLSYKKNGGALNIDTPAPIVRETLPPPADEKTLNLSLPQTPSLMDHAVELPDKQHNLHKLFEAGQKSDTVSVGGRLLVDDNPKPNAGMLDKVKGAEVGITIKTP